MQPELSQMPNSSVPRITFTATGVSAPAESDILAGVQADFNAAFGGNMNMALSTSQGQLATTEAALIKAKNDLFLQFVNQIDPATSFGRMQDAIGRLYQMDRIAGTPTVVQVTCSGLAGTVIPIGMLVPDVDGNKYACTQAGTIASNGMVTLPFAAIVNGPTPCGAGAITTIYQSIIGLDSVTNAAAGVLGTLVESRADFEFRRQQSVAKNALGTLQAIYSAVFSVAGVTDAYVIQNVTDNPVVNGAITLLPHSIYACASGGLDADIAQAIFRSPVAGANTNGNTSVIVQDASGYANPVPTYAIKFQRPTDLTIAFAITVQNLSGQPNSTLTPLIQNAVLSAFAGGDGGQRARIGSTIFASRFFAAIASAGPLAIISALINGGTSVDAGIDQRPVLSASNIAVSFV
jgi:uncharacterized phage protein gp47/JayE